MDPKFRKGYYTGYIFASILYILITAFLILLGGKVKAEPVDNCEEIECMIATEARSQGVPVEVAIAVGKVESGLNQSAIGPFGEIGVFQIRPEYTTANIYDLRGNIREGVRQLAYWKIHCPVKHPIAWVSCYNQGFRNPRFPFKLAYVKKIVVAMEAVK